MTPDTTPAKCAALFLVMVLASAPVADGLAQGPAQTGVTGEIGSDAVNAKSPALVDALDRAGELETAGRFSEIDAVLQPWADLGDPDVDYTRAYALFAARMNGLHESEFASVDLAEVEQLAERAAGNGHGGAMNLLYMTHGNGYGRAVDMPKAMEYLNRAVAAGDIGARVSLATMLYEGRPWLPRDRERACRMFVDFATVEGAGAFSLYYLGLATVRGECGLDEDLAKGVDFIRRAAEGGVRDAERDFGKALEKGVGVERDIDEALKWYESAGSHGDGYALWRLGMAHVDGEGRAKDPVRAVEYFRRAAPRTPAAAMPSSAWR
ncbi:tetratricopeptide repeat protein [Arenimonas daejeonensis]|uniref:tetratricopeptide repeat protein n=1 Tax=Arenimonas daejeonensis TaxID=370777 RepID=UPI0011BE2B33|nr:tetratricopeptide repeat protein [Arenimonas daejeonensis]